MNKNLVLFFTFFLSIIICVLLNTQNFSPKFDQAIREDYFWVNKANLKDSFEVVILGDSRVLRGVNPDFLDFAAAVYNFSFRSLELTQDIVHIASEKLKDQNSWLIIGLTPHSLVETKSPNDHYYQYRNITLEDRILRQNYLFSKLFSPFRDGKFNKNRRPKYQKKFYPNGFIATDLKESEIAEGLETYKKMFYSKNISMDKFENILNFLKNKSINAIFFRMPSCKEMEILENKFSGFDEEIISEKVRESGFFWIDIPSKFNYETYDASHLKPSSAETFSKELNHRIKEALGSSL